MATESTESTNQLLTESVLLKGRWKIVGKIGQGAFGEIYKGADVITQELVAVKAERVNHKKQVLRLEVAVLKKLQTCPYVCRFIYCGRHNDVNYLIMQLLGDNLSELRRRCPQQKFSLGTTTQLGLQMIKSVACVHDEGYLHRDLKPSNFAMGRGNANVRRCYIIDFGLSRKYTTPEGDVRPARDSTGFRGTARYASIASHRGQELGRRDDMWSLLYLMVEFVKGQLPWRRLKDKESIGEMKEKIPTDELLSGLPPEFFQFARHIEGLGYAERPDYDLLCRLLVSMCARLQIRLDDPYDWEDYTNTSLSETSNDPPRVLNDQALKELSRQQGANDYGDELKPRPPLDPPPHARFQRGGAKSGNGQNSEEWRDEPYNETESERARNSSIASAVSLGSTAGQSRGYGSESRRSYASLATMNSDAGSVFGAYASPRPSISSNTRRRSRDDSRDTNHVAEQPHVLGSVDKYSTNSTPRGTPRTGRDISGGENNHENAVRHAVQGSNSGAQLGLPKGGYGSEPVPVPRRGTTDVATEDIVLSVGVTPSSTGQTPSSPNNPPAFEHARSHTNLPRVDEAPSDNSSRRNSSKGRRNSGRVEPIVVPPSPTTSPNKPHDPNSVEMNPQGGHADGQSTGNAAGVGATGTADNGNSNGAAQPQQPPPNEEPKSGCRCVIL